MKRIAVLASGSGSNLQAILDHFATFGESTPAKVVIVASDRPQCGAIERARFGGVDAVVLRDAREPESPELEELLVEREIDYVALAGYLRLIPARLVDQFAGRMLNVHPALLPAHGGPGMYGLRIHQAVINAHESVSGATVHFVTHEYDSGPVVAQWPVPVMEADDAHTLAARVLTIEHALYPRVLEALARGRRNIFPICPAADYLAHPPMSPEDLRRDISVAFGGPV